MGCSGAFHSFVLSCIPRDKMNSREGACGWPSGYGILLSFAGFNFGSGRTIPI